MTECLHQIPTVDILVVPEVILIIKLTYPIISDNTSEITICISLSFFSFSSFMNIYNRCLAKCFIQKLKSLSLGKKETNS
jgi:hypothetical protein